MSFGYLMTGWPLCTEGFTQTDPTHFLISLPPIPNDTNSTHHVAVFLTQPLPEGLAATVHYSMPTSNTVEWKLLGGLSNDKPSAIFKISGWSQLMSPQLGLSVVPMQAAMSLLQQQQQQQQQQSSSTDLILRDASNTGLNAVNPEFVAQKVLENLYNYAMSFVSSSSQLPVKVFQDWYAGVQRKLKMMPDMFAK